MARTALSRERIVAAAIAILDRDGEEALTFRALAAHLATGAGALYWHVADKQALLSAATDRAIAEALSAGDRSDARATALVLYDAIEARPWIGTHLSREPWQIAMRRIFEAFGGHLVALGVPDEALFDAVSVLVHAILGVAAQQASAARMMARAPAGVSDRETFLAAMVATWTEGDWPFVHRIAARLRDHDDRAQFLAGIDFALAGIAASTQFSRSDD
jgi:AcrR family transcriptional regulator